MTDKLKNHLAGQTSPYLLQHLYNPVDWYPWSEAAFEKAKKENKLMLISIGYSSCHWCHVMEKESFIDREVAELMNSNFVCIKVDREERPDIDNIYMRAVQLLSGQGGWPLNCFALPDGKPFWGGTYFPKKNWIAVLNDISVLYQNQPDKITDQAEKLTKGIDLSSRIEINKNIDNSVDYMACLKELVNKLNSQLDYICGGLQGAPKFPMPSVLIFLLSLYHHTNQPEIIEHVRLTLKKMAMGGIYDQIGGGFARYATDMFWKVPHFEKMLYDNAQLVSLYCFAWQVTKEPLFKEVVFETLEFIEHEMTSSEGFFYSAIDADSEGVEGLYYLWKEDELDKLLGCDSELVKKYFQVEGQGNWKEGLNILFRKMSMEDFAREENISIDDLKGKIKNAKSILLYGRQKKTRPLLDDKCLVAWNSLMIKAYADAFAAFGEDKFRERAEKALSNIFEKCIISDGGLLRVYKEGRASVKGFLDDYAFLIEASLAVYQITAKEIYLIKAKELCDYAVKFFYDTEVRFFFFSSSEGEKLVSSNFDIHDNVISSSCSVMSRNLFWLGSLFGSEEMLEMSRNMLDNVISRKELYGIGLANWAILLLYHLYGFYSVAVCGSQANKYSLELLETWSPDRFVAASTGYSSAIPFFKDRFVEGKTLFYVCREGFCLSPVETVKEARELTAGKQKEIKMLK